MNAEELQAMAENLSALSSQIEIVLDQSRGKDDLIVVTSKLREALSRVYNASEYLRAMQKEERLERGICEYISAQKKEEREERHG
jgi:hypothetical protein